MFNGDNLTICSDVNPDTYGKVTKTQKNTTHKKANRSDLSQQVMNRHDSITKKNTTHNKKIDPQKKNRLGTTSKQITGGLKHA